MRNILNILFTSIIFFTSLLLPVMAADEPDKNVEYNYEIAFILNFLKFVEWSDDHSPKNTNSLKICVAGDDDFSNYFSEFARKRSQRFEVIVKIPHSDSDFKSCNILLIGRDKEREAVSLLAKVKNNSVITISEAKGFADAGGIIEILSRKKVGLFANGENVDLRINLKASELSHLNIDARFLQVASEIIR
ncbi:MAG: YfiR family protein [Pseudomonadota bacterium]